MTKIKLDRKDLIDYLATVKLLKNQISIEKYKKEYFWMIKDGSVPKYKINEYCSEHTELRRLEKRKDSLMSSFICELNPISQSAVRTSAKSSGTLDVFLERMIYQKTLLEKSDEEIIALVIKQRTEATLELQHSVENRLQQLKDISSELEAKIDIPSRPKRTM
ncbi:DUF4756 family protein [Salmonella enterica]|nr:DUF4756 family protein [Salmonella enterica]EBM9946297.1 DUF4756 family protein [Salmonella enterica subsp. enterica serovar Give]ECI4632568.1 DUF4756 domain-containing protein [Salmonella enterica subsp. enterica serovar Hartford]ECT8082959.1 DUF4756 family protein [Salmonella enterica subsp. enterica serovar Carrau]EDQ6554845.1 DUF4756 family protein [Salmonella enterica subsp. enterica]EDR3140489.1 DUF4756 family protein [Salmonella enterica subsp. enterica serovar Horsham]